MRTTRRQFLALSGGALGTAYMVMDRVAGETIARRILRDGAYAGARAGLTADLTAGGSSGPSR